MKLIRNASATEIGCLGKQKIDLNKGYNFDLVNYYADRSRIV